MNIITKRKQRHSPGQRVPENQQADRFLAEGRDITAGLRELNVTEATYYRRRNHYAGLKTEDAKKMLAHAERGKAVVKELAEGEFYTRRADVRP